MEAVVHDGFMVTFPDAPPVILKRLFCCTTMLSVTKHGSFTSAVAIDGDIAAAKRVMAVIVDNFIFMGYYGVFCRFVDDVSVPVTAVPGPSREDCRP